MSSEKYMPIRMHTYKQIAAQLSQALRDPFDMESIRLGLQSPPSSHERCVFDTDIDGVHHRLVVSSIRPDFGKFTPRICVTTKVYMEADFKELAMDGVKLMNIVLRIAKVTDEIAIFGTVFEHACQHGTQVTLMQLDAQTKQEAYRQIDEFSEMFRE